MIHFQILLENQKRYEITLPFILIKAKGYISQYIVKIILLTLGFASNFNKFENFVQATRDSVSF